MIVLQRPSAVELAAQMTDYIIDTDVTISFSVQFKGKTILSEEYVPDANNQVRIRKLGKFCSLALAGTWPTGNVTQQTLVAGTFTFFFNKVKDTDTLVFYSRYLSRKTASDAGFLTCISEKVTRGGAEWVSAYLTPRQSIEARYMTPEGVVKTEKLCTQAAGSNVVTVDVSLSRIKSLFKVEQLNRYEVVFGKHVMTFHVDETLYLDTFTFRFRNCFDCPETVTAVGPVTLKGGDTSETGYLYGVKRKFHLQPGDEYTANSGQIFLQSDYRLWHDFVNALDVEIQVDGAWYPIVISKQKFERSFRRNVLKTVEFSFSMADPEQNSVLL